MSVVRTPLALALLVLAACKAPPPPAADPHARVLDTLAGFRGVSALVDERLAAAAAWAVFPDVEDTQQTCLHEGLLFTPDGSTRACRLRCAARPAAPGGLAYHQLVILTDPADVARLESGGLDISDAAHLSVHDDPGERAGSATRWVVTSARASLLFDAPPLHQELRLVVAAP